MTVNTNTVVVRPSLAALVAHHKKMQMAAAYRQALIRARFFLLRLKMPTVSFSSVPLKPYSSMSSSLLCHTACARHYSHQSPSSSRDPSSAILTVKSVPETV